ncbi:type I restriction endonuclease [Methanosarcina sp.]|uniref:type I restriction endonuclease n=1 Tax=Methanosarcina sp. TaxID=2213 RepID=UPI00298991A5|nr:type I restriction endonuclease [Methanosarcina sp.]MDW5550371.1 type I restriction endonuclease [Methanosarcina sp.]MDW5554695.1 type I restriction endonuclease [Methanosarcina sp.]MDW5560482.1 type I restriction endonuclease [Methanosarcina sp.]
MSYNQNPEQKARNGIDRKLNASGWTVQEKSKIDWSVSRGIAVKEYLTNVGPADYVLFVNKKPVGIIEAKKDEEGHRLNIVEEQSSRYATSKLKYLKHDPLPFVYESTVELTRFTDFRDPKPRSKPVFSFYRPETFEEYLKKKSLRERLLDLPEL